MKPKEPAIPPEQYYTIRQRLIELLADRPLSTREISVAVHISEKEVGAHLEHLRRTLQAEGRMLVIIPATCRSCGFVFSKRDRLKKPGRCPVCRKESIEEPRFGIG